jgi:hypothetical protein
MSNEKKVWSQAIYHPQNNRWYKITTTSKGEEILDAESPDALEKGNDGYHDHFFKRDNQWFCQTKIDNKHLFKEPEDKIPYGYGIETDAGEYLDYLHNELAKPNETTENQVEIQRRLPPDPILPPLPNNDVEEIGSEKTKDQQEIQDFDSDEYEAPDIELDDSEFESESDSESIQQEYEAPDIELDDSEFESESDSESIQQEYEAPDIESNASELESSSNGESVNTNSTEGGEQVEGSESGGS